MFSQSFLLFIFSHCFSDFVSRFLRSMGIHFQREFPPPNILPLHMRNTSDAVWRTVAALAFARPRNDRVCSDCTAIFGLLWRKNGITFVTTQKVRMIFQHVDHPVCMRYEFRYPFVLTRLFIVYVRPLLEYASQVWSPSDPYFDKRYVNLIENVQRRFTKRVFRRCISTEARTYTERLKTLSLQTLEFRRFFFDLVMVCCIVQNEIHLSFDEFFKISPNIGRARFSNRYKLFVKRYRSNAFIYFFSNRVVHAWNSLPQPIVNASSIKSFKNLLLKVIPVSLGFRSLIDP
ncbi:hypothetical protein AB6A40_011598 [Gnathostoma spinigerum]|uniref:Uncharacterized protein n=1 Tax=Gnathostoma spinigerum TaxID=75299 RepID=A0ABD6F3N9_9BILA